jgi:hypothetical protein
LLHILPRLASTKAFLCLIPAQCEWPDMILLRMKWFICLGGN